MDNVSEAIKFITEESKKVKHFEQQRARYVEIAQKIREFSVTLNTFANEIDPFSCKPARASKPTGSHGKYNDIAKELFEMLKAGTQVTAQLIRTTYPDLEDRSVQYVLKMLKAMPKVEVAKDKNKLRLFYRYS